MKPLLVTISLALTTMLPVSAVLAAGMLTDPKGMTLYVFDKDSKDKSACYDACAKLWPPYLVKEGKESGEGWSKVKRKDGSMQWAYDGKPLYYYAEDMKAGDSKGDGFKGIWHTVAE